jgi:hypothetical protein
VDPRVHELHLRLLVSLAVAVRMVRTEAAQTVVCQLQRALRRWKRAVSFSSRAPNLEQIILNALSKESKEARRTLRQPRLTDCHDEKKIARVAG